MNFNTEIQNIHIREDIQLFFNVFIYVAIYYAIRYIAVKYLLTNSSPNPEIQESFLVQHCIMNYIALCNIRPKTNPYSCIHLQSSYVAV